MDRVSLDPQNAIVRAPAWILAALAALSLGASLVLALQTDPGAVTYLLTIPIPFLAAGIYLLWRHPGSRTGPLMVGGVAFTMAFAALLEQAIKRAYPAGGVQRWMSGGLAAEAVILSLGLACLSLLIGLFPTGSPVDRVERLFARAVWLLPLPMILALMSNESIATDGITYGALGPFPSPLHVDALEALSPVTGTMRYAIALVLVVAVGMLLRRYRGTEAAERRQIRWVLYGSALAVLIAIGPFAVLPAVDGTIAHGALLSFSSLALLLIPLSVVIAVEQPGWIDTDAVIRRSFTYVALSAALLLVYGAAAAGLGLAAGAALPVEVAIIITVVALLVFEPARRRLQRVADRWVFGPRPDAIEAVTGFDAAVAEADPGELPQRLATTVRTAARLRWVEVELDGTPGKSGVRQGDPALIIPIRRGEEDLGVVRCGPAVVGTLTAEDAGVVAALAAQAGLVVSSARLAARIVQAHEVERRRLERNLHDGAQQELVALVAKLGLARTEARRGTVDEATLGELQRDVQTILRDLRDLAQGIHPTVLSDAGLVEAVEDRCSRMPLPVVVDVTPDLRGRRFTDDVEGAAYFFVTEGLANLLKHAGATSARVGLRQENGHLEITVADDGLGFDPDAIRRNGLAGLTDRFAALAGTVDVDARPGQGTQLRARLPVI